MKNLPRNVNQWIELAVAIALARSCMIWIGVQNIGTICLDERRIKSVVKKFCTKLVNDINIEINELSVMPDHIHSVVVLTSTMSISQAFHLLKGASSHELFKRKQAFRRRYAKGRFWSPGNFYRTVGVADAELVINYVREHRFQQMKLNGFHSTTNHA